MSAARGAPQVREFRSPDAAATERLGAAFGRAFQPLPQRALRVALRGDLGAGKTTFVRGLLREFGVTGAIRSPTYGLVERYPTARAEVLHADLYRLTGPEDLAALALEDADVGGALWLVEWPERAGAALPPPDLLLALQVEADGHRLRAAASSPAGHDWLARIGSQAALEVAPSSP